MRRREFFKNGSLFTLGSFLSTGAITYAQNKKHSTSKKAKNIIFMVSDGMSAGTLSMADQLLYLKDQKASNWLNLYREGKVQRGLMETASANSLVTDSAAASSSWGGGVRVPNGSLNVDANGEGHLPILQKFKKRGKKVGCVTTVPITHATPAGFCVMQESRNDQDTIAETYAELEFDVMMGGGGVHFSKESRTDAKDMYQIFNDRGYAVFRDRKELFNYDGTQKILGVFAPNALPYALDRAHDKDLLEKTPSLAEMTQRAIRKLDRQSDSGFVLQVEGGKVDWAAHANDAAALLYDQIAFDEAIKEAIDFAENDGNTLVIITTDHGNANPGLIKSALVDQNFENLQHFKHTNEWILNQIKTESSASNIRELIAEANGGKTISREQSKILATHFQENNAGLYNVNNLPFKSLSLMQEDYTSIGWISMEHSGDDVEIAAFGPGSEHILAFQKNYELHDILLEAAEVENDF